jgi:hypothetical protein
MATTLTDDQLLDAIGNTSPPPDIPAAPGGISDDELFKMIGGEPDPVPVLPDPIETQLPAALQTAVDANPDEAAESLRLSRDLEMPVDQVRGDLPAARREQKLRQNDPATLRSEAPITAQWLSQPHNAEVALEDVDILKGLEQRASTREGRRGYWENQARGFADTMSKIATEGVAGAAWLSEEISKPFTRAYDEAVYLLTGERGGTEAYMQASEESMRGILDQMEESSKQYYDYEQRADIKKVIESPTPANVGEFIAEAGPSSIPYMVAAGISYPLIVSVVGNMVAEERVANDERKGIPSDKDMYIGAATSMVTGLIERFSLSKLIKSGAAPVKEGLTRYATVEMLKGAGREAGTEFIQEGVEAIGGAIGTEKGLVAGDIFEQALAGGLVGAGMGAGVRAGTVYPEYSQQIHNAAVKDTFKSLESSEAQDWLDDYISMAQSTKVGERSPEQFREFLETVDPEARVFLKADIAGELEGAPDYVVNQLDGTGADVSISMTDFLTDFATDDQRLAFVRPHIKIREDLKTLNELEETGTSDQVKRLIEKAEKHQAAKTEADMIYEQVKDQLVQTRRQGEHTARLSAELIPAYITTAHADLQARGHDVSVKELYEKMGMRIVGPGKVDGDGRVLKQEPWELTRQEYERPVELKPQESIYVNVGREKIEVIQNPTGADISAMTKESIEKYGRPGNSDPVLRFTEDAAGNRYYWPSFAAIHATMEPLLTSRVGEKLSQNEASKPSHRSVVRRALYEGRSIPPEVIAEYPGLREEVSQIPGAAIAPKLLRQQNFGDITLTDEVDGNVVTVEAQRVWDYNQKRLEMVERLRECLKS